MNIERFWHILKTDLEYNSPRRYRFLVKSLPGWATFIYYTRLLRVIIKESLYLQKNTYDRIT